MRCQHKGQSIAHSTASRSSVLLGILATWQTQGPCPANQRALDICKLDQGLSASCYWHLGQTNFFFFFVKWGCPAFSTNGPSLYQTRWHQDTGTPSPMCQSKTFPDIFLSVLSEQKGPRWRPISSMEHCRAGRNCEIGLVQTSQFIDLVTKPREEKTCFMSHHKTYFVKLSVCNVALMTVCQSLWLVMAYNDM